MAERPSWAAGSQTMSVADGRLAVGAFAAPGTSMVRARSGIRPGPGSPGLVTASGSPDVNVSVAPFQAVIQTARAAAGGTYLCTLDAAKSIDMLTGSPAHVTNPRHDLIIAQQQDTFYGDASNAFLVKQVVGVPSGAPSDPDVPGSPDYVVLARVKIRAGAATILSTDITDLRGQTGWACTVGGIQPAASAAARDTFGTYPGHAFWVQDANRLDVASGTEFRTPATPVVAGVAGLAALTPYEGLLAVDTASRVMHSRTGSTWQPIMTPTEEDEVAGFSPTLSITTTGYEPVPGLEVPFTKLYDGTGLRAEFKGSAFSAGGGYGIWLGVQLDIDLTPTDFDVGLYFFNHGADHMGFRVSRRLPGIPAGTYTMRGRAKLTGAGTVNFNMDDRLRLSLTEII